MDEPRLARLEETLFFQERLLQDLNTALTAQQRQIDHLERRVERLTEENTALRAMLDAGNGPVNTPPPHYL